eukprot:scaffold3947_cov189-Ochromonas_danica.AAC.1
MVRLLVGVRPHGSLSPCPSCLVWNMAHGLNGPGVNRPWRSLFLEGLKHAAASTQSVVREPLVPLLNGDG